MEKSYIQFVADRCNEILSTKDEKHYLNYKEVDDFFDKKCIDVMCKMGIIFLHKDEEGVTQTGQLFLTNKGKITAKDVSIFL